MAIASSTFISDIILFLRNYVRTNVSDPLSRTDGVGFVMTSYPKRNVQYPIITIKQTNSTTSKLGMSSETHLANIDTEIRVWARNAKECDELAQSVIDKLRDAEYSATGTDIQDIFGFVLTSAVPIVETEGDNSIHSKVLTFNYKAILS